MNVHIALYRWKAGVTEGEVKRALAAIEALSTKVPGIVEIRATENTSQYSEGYTHVILVRATTQSALDAYRVHPDHAKAARQIEAMEEHGIGVDFGEE